MLRISAVCVTLGCLTFTAVPAGAGESGPEEFPLAGNYMQNTPCKGTAADQAALKVSISPQQIVSNIGVCTILDSKQEGDSFHIHVECKFPAGPLVGDLTFTPMPDNTVKFVDRDKTYNSILHRCPG